MDFLTLLKSAIGLLPTLIEAIKAIEAAVPQGGQGAAKLDAVRAIIQSGYNVASALTPSFEQLWPVLSGIAGAVVTLFNKTGVFVKSSI